MADGIRPSSICANLLAHFRRPMTLGCESGTLSQRELQLLALFGRVLLAVGALGAYATASEWREHGPARDTIQLTLATVITVAMSAWLGFLVRKHRHAAAPIR